MVDNADNADFSVFVSLSPTSLGDSFFWLLSLRNMTFFYSVTLNIVKLAIMQTPSGHFLVLLTLLCYIFTFDLTAGKKDV